MDYPQVGQLARVTRGPFKGYEGNIQKVSWPLEGNVRTGAGGRVQLAWTPVYPVEGGGSHLSGETLVWFRTEDTELVEGQEEELGCPAWTATSW
jgi:hypothetical protein